MQVSGLRPCKQVVPLRPVRGRTVAQHEKRPRKPVLQHSSEELLRQGVRIIGAGLEVSTQRRTAEQDDAAQGERETCKAVGDTSVRRDESHRISMEDAHDPVPRVRVQGVVGIHGLVPGLDRVDTGRPRFKLRQCPGREFRCRGVVGDEETLEACRRRRETHRDEYHRHHYGQENERPIDASLGSRWRPFVELGMLPALGDLRSRLGKRVAQGNTNDCDNLWSLTTPQGGTLKFSLPRGMIICGGCRITPDVA